jgi:amidase
LLAGGATVIADALRSGGWGDGALAQQAAAAGQSGWSFRSAKDLAAALKKRDISAVELLEQVIARVEALDGRLNAVVVRDFERARAAVKRPIWRSGAVSRGRSPMTIKESFNVAGLPTTWGIPRFKDFVAKEDALIVSRVKQAGAVIVGKTNVPIVLGGWQSYNEIYGTTNNPWDLGRTPGGSSGGSAAALAAGFGRCRSVAAGSGPLLWHLRPQADLGSGASAGTHAAEARPCRATH